MKISKKRTVQVMVFAIALLLVLALSIGITGAWYQAKRQASGTVIMNQGIIIDYQGFGQATDGIWTKENATNFILFTETDAQPGQNIAVNASSIRANVDSVDFYARVKLGYEFYDGETKLTEETLTAASFNVSDLITTSANFFGANWVESSDGWFYYGTGTTLGKLTPSANDAGFVALFANDAKFVIEGANFEGADDGQGGGFVVNETTSINKIEVTLTLETLQGSADAAAEGWTITPILRVDISNLTSNTQIENIVTTISPTMGDVYLTGNPATPVEISIGSRAFAGCSDLGLNLSDASNATYIIASDAFEGAATVNYGSRDIKNNILNATQSYNSDLSQMTPISGTKVYAYQPTAFTPTGSSNTSYGRYQYTDSQGTWYYEIVDKYGDFPVMNPAAAVRINCVDSNLITITMPQYIPSSEVGGVGFPVVAYGASNSLKIGNVQNMIIPGSVKKINESAFSGCSGLKSITIGSGVTSIGNNAFYGCSGLTTITIPDSVTSIGNSVFAHCSGLTSVTIGNSITSIESYAFSYCNELTSITIPNSVTSIGQQAFENCSGLTSITIPSSVTSIERSAFMGCTGLTSITIPDSVTSIRPSAFSNCSGLKSITIPNRVTSIGDGAFSGCSGLTSITIPNGVTSIGSGAFEDCSGLTTITIPDSVTSIGMSVFSGCSGLTSITIPSGVASIGFNAFYNCTRLTEVVIDSVTIAKLSNDSSYLLRNATKVYVKTGLTVGSWITGSGFTKQSTSDKAGYALYTK